MAAQVNSDLSNVMHLGDLNKALLGFLVIFSILVPEVEKFLCLFTISDFDRSPENVCVQSGQYSFITF